MKKRTAFILAAAFFIATTFSGCENTGTKYDDSNFDKIMSEYSPAYVYEGIQGLQSFAIGDDGTVYVSETLPLEDSSGNSSGEGSESVPADGDESFSGDVSEGVPADDAESVRAISAYSPDGKRQRVISQGYSCNGMAYYQNSLFICCPEERDQGSIYRLNLDGGEPELVVRLPRYANNIIISNDTIYFTSISEKKKYMDCPYKKLGFTYDGTAVYSCNINGGEVREEDIPFPCGISTSHDGQPVIYALDENGAYFTVGIDGEKNYSEFDTINSFAFINDELDYVFQSDASNVLNLGKLEISSSRAEIMEEVSVSKGGNIKCRGGYTFFINNVYKLVGSGEYLGVPTLQRIKNSDFLQKNEPIRFISPENVSNKPFGCGYMIDYKELDDQSFALSVLSQDSGFDMCIVNSQLEFAENIRSKGSFYPLNDVPGVEEYLDKFFPYVKEAAVNEHGDIWMLPVELTADAIIFDTQLCGEAGIDLYSIDTPQSLIECAKAAEQSSYSLNYDLHTYPLTQNYLVQYLENHDSLNTPLFKELAAFCKESMNLSFFPSYMPIIASPDSEGKFLFYYMRYTEEQRQYVVSVDGCDAVPLPLISEEGIYPVFCTFLTVNPASSNLDGTLEYISDLCALLSSQENSFILSNSSCYTEKEAVKSLYEIYQSGRIVFNIPSEIIMEDYLRYCSGELTQEQFIQEADRKLSAYRNE